MPHIKRSQVVPHTPAQMYALVDDVCSYSDFVTWCVRSEELSRDEDTVQGKLTFAASGVEKSFTTMNRLLPHKMIELRLVDGPFKQLEGFWAFEVEGEGASRVTLNLEFEFSSRLLAMMFGPVFEQVASSLVQSFIDRAAIVYDH